MRGRKSYSVNDAGEITSRRSDSYVVTQFQEHPAHYQVRLLKFERAFLGFQISLFESKVSLTSIFGDKKTKKGLY